MPDWAAISIAEDAETKLKDGWYAIHRAYFDDVYPEHHHKKYKPRILMSSSDADDIVAFVESVSPDVSTIFVNCKGGISRSAAVAKWIAKRFDLKFDHDYSLYNQHVYKLMCEAGQRYKQRRSIADSLAMSGVEDIEFEPPSVTIETRTDVLK